MSEQENYAEERGFKGVWIPKERWEDENLSLTEMCLLVEIDSLDKDGEGCFASNKYLAKFIRKTPKYVSNLLSTLRKRGYLTVEIFRDEKQQIEKRILRATPIHKNVDTLSTKMWQTYPQKNGYPIHKNVEESNTNISNTINNKYIVSGRPDNPDDDGLAIREVVEYLNERTGKKFKPNAKDTVKRIKARLAENYTVDDLKRVIDIKTKEWENDAKMTVYLRPETLFGSKFESYLNSEVSKTFAVEQMGDSYTDDDLKELERLWR